MPQVKDKRYVQFLKTGLITPIPRDEFAGMLSKVKHKARQQARAVVILMYYSGRRPVEILELTGEAIKKEGKHIVITFPTKKGGKYSVMYYPLNAHFTEVWEYAKSLYPNQFFGWCFRGKCNNRVTYKLKDGTVRVKNYKRTNTTLRYFFKKWFGITPYFFRHNRFSEMAAKGATFQEIKHAKGAANLKSVEPYIHLSVDRAKKMSKYFK